MKLVMNKFNRFLGPVWGWLLVIGVREGGRDALKHRLEYRPHFALRPQCCYKQTALRIRVVEFLELLICKARLNG
jgi:hypothetical protein